jgi:folate-binding protein YgfZ
LAAHYCVLEKDALLHIVGPDTLKFLQGQTTCDTDTVTDTRAAPGAYCTPQGRVVCDFLLSKLGESHYALRMRREIIANSAAVFGKYIIFSKADLEPERSDWRCIGVWGDGAEAALASLLPTLPAEPWARTGTTGVVAVRFPGAVPAFECYVHEERAEAIESQLESAASPGEEDAWQGLQLRAGIARIGAGTVEEFVPQTLNYDLTGHVNFRKGCYTGQEVVARLHYRGTPKRRTYLATLAGTPPPTEGTAIYAADNTQPVGHVVDAAVDGGTTIALVAVTIEAAQGTLHLDSPDGASFSATPPPYSLEKSA